MFKYNKLIIGIFLILFSLNIGFSNGPELICCYSPNQDVGISPQFSNSGSCNNPNEVFLGNADSINLCSEFESERKGCIINDICYGLNSQGGRMYGDSALCSGTSVPISNPLCVGSNLNIAPGSDSSQSGQSPVEQGEAAEFEEAFFQDTLDISESQVLCNNAGSPFGLFVSKQSCEAISANGENCLYNPNRAGILSSKFIFQDLLNIENEQSCIVRSSIKSCFMYKTKDNCESNPSKDSSQNNELQFGCKWIEPDEFASTIFSDTNGFCISEYHEDSYFNSKSYARRGNLISDSSFEKESFDELYNIKEDILSPFGSKVLKLNSSEEFTLTIDYLESSIAYSFFTYVKLLEDFTSEDLLSLKIEFLNKEFDSIGTSQEDSIFFKDIYEIENFSNYYEKVLFPSSITPEDVFSVTITLKSTLNIYIGSISFYSNPQKISNKANLIYSPEPVVPVSASNCNLCFDPLGMNLCSEEKSDLLGDCSYMVKGPESSYGSNLDFYLGKDSNPITSDGDILSNWKAQSLSNSLLFCEMYVSKSTCLDPDSYINDMYSVYHPNSGDTLCKWSEQYGCFKDSNNQNLPDVIGGVPTFIATHLDFVLGMDDYIYSNEAGSSDFEFACDTLPPNAFFYFRGKNKQNETIFVSDSYDEVIGNVFLHFRVSDVLMDSCKQFNSFENKLYITVKVENDNLLPFGPFSFIKEYNLNQESFRSSNLEGFFEYYDGEGNSILSEGKNTITFTALDQSGNVGGEWSFDVDLDLYGPSIELLEENNFFEITNIDNGAFITNVLGKDSYFNFTISDYSSIEYCSYELLSQNNADPNHYTKEGTLDLSNIDYSEESGSNGIVHFPLPITNTSSSGDSYILDVTCMDVFEQTSTYYVSFNINMNTDFVLISPAPYIEGSTGIGFIGPGPFTIHAASTDSKLDSCYIEFDSGELGEFTIDVIEDGFSVPSYSPSVILFYSNLTTQITFTGESGLKTGTYLCEDDLGNEITGEILYWYENSAPDVFLKNIIGTSSVQVKNIDNNWYFWQASGLSSTNFLQPVNSLFGVDGLMSTFSSISVAINGVEPNCEVKNDLSFNLLEIENSKELLVRSSFPNRIVCVGEEIEKNLEKYNSIYNFTTLVGNTKELDVEFFLDTSKPYISFGGNGVSFSSTTNTLYFSNENPNIVLDFNAPSYRKFSCNIKATQGRFTISNQYNNITSFELASIGSIDLNSGVDIELELLCSDVYGHSISRNVLVKKDDTKPILTDITLSNGLNKYYRNLLNYEYPQFSDSIQFILEDTNEDGYICHYKFDDSISNGLYDCDETLYNVSFSNSGTQVSGNVNILFGNSNPICVPTPLFYEKVKETAEKQNLNTKIRFGGYCEDLVGLTTSPIEKIISIDYVISDLVDLTFTYNSGYAYPTFVSLYEFDSSTQFHISRTQSYQNSFFTFRGSAEFDNGLYYYTSSEGIDLSEFSQGEHIVHGFAISGDTEVGKIVSTLVVDNNEPLLNVDILDEFEGKIYTDYAIVSIDSFDIDSGLNRVEILLDGRTIFSHYSGQEPIFSNSSISQPFNSYFTNNNKNFETSVELINLVYASTYLLEVKSWDNGGNMAHFSKSFEVIDGVGLNILTSENTFVGLGAEKQTWFTKNTAPILNFKTTRDVTSCTIYPFDDPSWQSLNLPNLGTNLGSGSEFSFDLSTLENFKLGFDSGIFMSKIKLQCIYENEVLNFSRDLRFVDILPDYVLTSSNGFILTQFPYSTNLEVNSVTPFNYLNCEFELDGVKTEFPQKDVGSFFLEFDFSRLTLNNNYDLILSCSDSLGTAGPKKVYSFYLEEKPLDVSNLIFSFDDEILTNDNGIYYLSTEKSYNMIFNVNKKDDVSCSYSSSLTGGVINGVFNFFRNIFISSQKELDSSSNPFEYMTSGVKFSSQGNYKLNIECSEGSQRNSFEFDINVISPESFDGNPSLNIN